ncbi:MAG: transposase [Chlamydiales bacterium]|jgi:transposase
MARETLTDTMWEKLSPLLPDESGYWGRPSRPHREIIEGILWVLRTGAPWRDIPEKYGPWNSCYTRFNRWSSTGIWENIWEVLKDDIDHENYAIDGSYIKAHQDACRIKKKRRL